jgi:hypothetical protein
VSRVADAAALLRAALAEHELDVEETSPGSFVVVLPGERKQRTTCSFVVGEHALTVQAFVARHVDENAEAVYRWLLERNLRMYAVAFAVDHLGDIYLTGRLPLASVTSDEIDRLLGSVLEYADGSFDTILELGFPTAIRREWEWRLARGESTANLQAFRHLAPADVASTSVVAPAFVRLADIPAGGSTSVVVLRGQGVVMLPPEGSDPAAWHLSVEPDGALDVTQGGARDSVVLNPGAVAVAPGEARLHVVDATTGDARTVVVVVEARTVPGAAAPG